MEHTLEHRIRERAYEIWNADSRANGRAEEHWLAAEREVLSSLGGQSPASKANRPRKSRSRTLSAVGQTTSDLQPYSKADASIAK
jgi:hypothetical protein